MPQLTSRVGVRVRVPVKLKSPEAPYAPQSPQPQSSARMKTNDGRSSAPDSSPWSSSLSGGIPLQLMLWLAPEMGSLPGSTQQALSATIVGILRRMQPRCQRYRGGLRAAIAAADAALERPAAGVLAPSAAGARRAVARAGTVVGDGGRVAGERRALEDHTAVDIVVENGPAVRPTPRVGPSSRVAMEATVVASARSRNRERTDGLKKLKQKRTRGGPG